MRGCMASHNLVLCGIVQRGFLLFVVVSKDAFHIEFLLMPCMLRD